MPTAKKSATKKPPVKARTATKSKRDYAINFDEERSVDTKWVYIHGYDVGVEPITTEQYYDLIEAFEKMSKTKTKLTSAEAKKALKVWRDSIEAVVPDLVGVPASPNELVQILNLAIETTIPDRTIELKKRGYTKTPQDHKKKAKRTVTRK